MSPSLTGPLRSQLPSFAAAVTLSQVFFFFFFKAKLLKKKSRHLRVYLKNKCFALNIKIMFFKMHNIKGRITILSNT
jgi:hypothetical protein